MADPHDTKETEAAAAKAYRDGRAQELREMYAGEAMGALLSNPNFSNTPERQLAERALKNADAMLVALGYEAARK